MYFRFTFGKHVIKLSVRVMRSSYGGEVVDVMGFNAMPTNRCIPTFLRNMLFPSSGLKTMFLRTYLLTFSSTRHHKPFGLWRLCTEKKEMYSILVRVSGIMMGFVLWKQCNRSVSHLPKEWAFVLIRRVAGRKPFWQGARKLSPTLEGK